MYKRLRKNISNNNDAATTINQDTKILTKSLEKNISLFEGILSNDQMLIVRRFQNKYLDAAKCCLLYFDGMINPDIINESIIQPILCGNLAKEISVNNLLEELQFKVIACNNIKASGDLYSIISSMFYGSTALLLEGYEKCLIIETKGWQTRSISEPESAKAVRGPREGFTESILVNLSLIRRKIRDSALKFRFMEIGERTRTNICICYIDGLALESILNELMQRLEKIKIDGIIDSGYIQELIKDAPFSPFETVGYSERPDVIAAKLLEGRIALFVDGSPFVLTVPFVIVESIQANEDYYNNYIFSSINRLIRSAAAIISVSVPALFLAIVTYHQEMLPTPLLLSISASRQGVPFPTSLSLFFMLLIFDVLREAGTRMPTPIGQAINIVGTLILGQAAVEARLVSAPVIIITALSGITTLLNPSIIGASIVVRFFLLLSASLLGIYGFIFGLLIIILHLMNLRSFGVPYMLNISRAKYSQDVWIRAPWWTMTLRPQIIAAKNLVRQQPGEKKVK